MLQLLNHLDQWLMGLMAGLFVGAPFALAWWLSDGFAGFLDWPAGGTKIGVAVNPHTNKTGLVVRSVDTGAVVAYTA